jgi:hypothetical protein
MVYKEEAEIKPDSKKFLGQMKCPQIISFRIQLRQGFTHRKLNRIVLVLGHVE